MSSVLISEACQHVFGVPAWRSLSADQRRVVIVDVGDMIDTGDCDQPPDAPLHLQAESAARILRARILRAHIGGYADVLLAGERRRASEAR